MFGVVEAADRIAVGFLQVIVSTEVATSKTGGSKSPTTVAVAVPVQPFGAVTVRMNGPVWSVINEVLVEVKPPGPSHE